MLAASICAHVASEISAMVMIRRRLEGRRTEGDYVEEMETLL